MSDSTWMCRFEVTVDFPSTMPISDMEQAIAFAVSQYLSSVNLPGNCSVQLVATAGNCSVANPTCGQPLVDATSALTTASTATPQGSL